jgi:hypothetical protein
MVANSRLHFNRQRGMTPRVIRRMGLSHCKHEEQ